MITSKRNGSIHTFFLFRNTKGRNTRDTFAKTDSPIVGNPCIRKYLCLEVHNVSFINFKVTESGN